MNPKASATLEKAREDRRRSNFQKALSRLEEAIGKFPKELPLYTEAIDAGMEAGESLKTIQMLRKSQRELPEDAFELWTFTVEKVGVYNDPIVGRFMLEQAIKSGDFTAAYAILQSLSDHAAGEVLEHTRTKKQTMSLAVGTRHAARDDVVSYTLGEALLHLRLGRTAEAMESFVRALDENPALVKPLERFLTDVEKRHEDSGDASHALGCCLIAGGRPSKGVRALVHAARRAPHLAPKVIQRIESLADHPDLPLDARQLNLAELYLGQGDTRRASELLLAVLERGNAMAGPIADLLKPVVETVGEDLDIQFVFVEATFAAGRRESGLVQLRKIHGRREHKAPLVEWLESKTHSGKLSAEVQLFFAETALSEGLHGKAIEIFKQMLSSGNQEHATIKELLSRYRSNSLVQHFYTERFGASSAGERAITCEFERYDDRGFAAPRARPSEREAAADSRPFAGGEPDAMIERVDVETSSLDAGKPLSSDGPGAPRPDIDNRDFSLSMHAPERPPADAPWGEEPWPHESSADTPLAPSPDDRDSDLFAYLKRDFSSQFPPNAGGTTDGVDEGTLEEEPAEANAEAFEDPAEDEVEQRLESEGEAKGGDAAPEDAHDDTTPLPDDFASLYRAFIEGTLDRGRTIEVMERAFEEDRMDEMKRLLAFEPVNLGEEIARKYQLARYYLATDQPVSALVTLKTVQLGALCKEERKTFLLRIAECYRRLHNYEAAHSVYLRVLSEYPGDRAAEAAAKTNYAMYVEAAAGAAPALEKLTNL